MGPMLIFDKSTLQSLSPDESVWLDAFFLTNIIPLFFVETLADLELDDSNLGRSRLDLIHELAKKTPIMGSSANVHHQRLVVGDLLGHSVDMATGRPILSDGVLKLSPEGKFGFHFSTPPEQIALERWGKGNYLEIEREFAKQWRQTLSNLSFDYVIGIIKNIVPEKTALNNSKAVKNFVDNFVCGRDVSVFRLAFDLLGIPEDLRNKILVRWIDARRPPMNIFAPYAAYVFGVDLFFYLSLYKSYISKERPNNKVDIAYLYYLPFCRVFVSNDKLHSRIAPLFMKNDQMFVRGQDFKLALVELNQYYQQLSQEIEEKGVFQVATYPPTELDNQVTKIWDKFFSHWRESAKEHKSRGYMPPKSDPEFVKRLNRTKDESIVLTNPNLISSDEADHIIVTRMVPVKKGNWRLFSKEVEDRAKERSANGEGDKK